MSKDSDIEWTDDTWNPLRGCTKISPGCKFCYAETFAERWRGIKDHPFEHGFDLRLVPEKLNLPTTWKKPKKIFVNSMSDLFHEGVPTDYIQRVFDVMVSTPRHTYQVLTKRSARLRELAPQLPWPENIHIGVSVENQKCGTERILDLCAVECAGVRFLSMEPMLEEVQIGLAGVLPADMGLGYAPTYTRIGWVIVGGESGRRPRPCEPAWIRAVVRECQKWDTPVFVKQLGGVAAKRHGLRSAKGGKLEEWPPEFADLAVREFPRTDAAATVS